MIRYLKLLPLLLLFVQFGVAQERPQIVLQRGHGGQAEIKRLSSSPDGRYAYTAASDGTVKVWNLTDRQVIRTIYDEQAFPNPEEIESLQAAAFSPNSDWVVTADLKGNFRRFSLPQGELLDSFENGEANDIGTSLRTDGQHLYYITSKNLVKTTLAGKVLHRAPNEGFSKELSRFALSPDGKYVALRSDNGLTVYATGSLSESGFKELNSNLSGLAFDESGSTLAIATNSAIALLDPQSLAVKSLLEDATSTRRAPVWRDGKLYVYPVDSGHSDHLQEVDFSTSELTSIGEKFVCKDMVVGADSRFLAGAFGGDSFILDPSSGEREELAGDLGGITTYTVHPTSRDLFTGSRTGKVLQWSAKTGRIAREYPGLDSYISAVSVSPDGKRLLVADYSYGKILCFDLKSGKNISSVDLRRGRYADGVKWVRWVDSNRYLYAAPRLPLKLVDANSGQELNSWPQGGKSPTSVALKGERIAVGYYGRMMESHLTNQRDVLVTSIPGGRGVVNFIAYGSDGKTIYAAKRRGGIMKWDSSSPKNKPQQIFRINSYISGFELQSNGFRLYLQDGEIRETNLAGSSLNSYQLADKFPWAPQVVDGVLMVLGPNLTLDFYNSKTYQREGQLVSVRDNDGWVAMERSGSFDGNDIGMETISFELDGESFGLSQFFKQYFRPGVLATLLPSAPAHTRTGPELTAGTVKKPPTVKIVEPASGTVLKSDVLEVKVRVSPRGAGVSKVALFHNGHKLSDKHGKKIDETNYLFTLRPVKGKNELKATAFDASGNVESRRDRVRVIAPNLQSRPPKLHLLSVGVDEYSSGLSLKFAEDDARSVSELFRSTLYKPGKRILLKNEEATLNGIKAAIAAVAQEAEPQDAFVFYLAGHGTVVGEEYYFLPHDVKVETDEALSQSALSSSNLAESLSTIPATKQLLVLDSCRSGKAIGVVSRYFSSRGGLEEVRSQQLLSRTSGTFLVAATKGEEYAYEIPQLGHGVLTYAVLDSLGLTEGHEKTGEVTANDLLRSVSTKVPDLSEKYHGVRQQVIQYSSGQDFPLMK